LYLARQCRTNNYALHAGDIKATRLVIYGALLGVLDPALTLAAAGAGNIDGTRLPNEAMMQAIAAAKDGASNVGDSSDREEDASAAESTAESTALSQTAGRFEWSEARELKDKRRLELAGDQIGDHAVTLAAYKVWLWCLLVFPDQQLRVIRIQEIPKGTMARYDVTSAHISPALMFLPVHHSLGASVLALFFPLLWLHHVYRSTCSLRSSPSSGPAVTTTHGMAPGAAGRPAPSLCSSC
jgi:hypothetical protein